LREIDAVKARHAFGVFYIIDTYNAEKKMNNNNQFVEKLFKKLFEKLSKTSDLSAEAIKKIVLEEISEDCFLKGISF